MEFSPPAYCRPSAYQLFQQQLPTIETDESLFRAAFAIALHERPEADLGEAETIIENLAETVSKRVRSRSTPALMAHLHDVLFDVFGLRGNVDDYYNPANSYLPDVLRSQRGLPITLVLIYKRVAGVLGIKVFGVNSPGHFLAVVENEDSSKTLLYIDPFFGGGVLSESEVVQRIYQTAGIKVTSKQNLLARATHRQWLGRMLNNLQVVFTALGQDREVYAMHELQALL